MSSLNTLRFFIDFIKPSLSIPEKSSNVELYLCAMAIFLALARESTLEGSYFKPSSRISSRVEILSGHTPRHEHSTPTIRCIVKFKHQATICDGSKSAHVIILRLFSSNDLAPLETRNYFKIYPNSWA